MSFLYPLFLVGAVATAIPVVLHFLRREVAPEVPFSAVRLLRRSPVERSRRHRLRDLILLATRVAALLLLAAAFARPYIAGAAAGSSPLRIVAVDRSYSMGAPGRFAHALDLARRAVEEAGIGGRVAVIAFDDRADLVAAPGSGADARLAVGGLRAGFGGTRYDALFTKAAEIADGRPARLVVIGDLQRAGWTDEGRPMLPADVELEVRDAGAPPPNLAIARVRVERDRIVASILNTGGEPRAGQLRVDRDGRTVASAAYAAGADSTVDVPIAYSAGGAGAVSVSLEDPAGFIADNTRYAVLDPPIRQAVLVVTSEGAGSGFYLSRALAAASGSAGDPVDAHLIAGTKYAPRDLATYSAVALLSTRGLDRRARESIAAFVRAGGGLLIAGAPDVEPAVVSTLFAAAPAMTLVEKPPAAVTLSATDLRHPIFRPFGALAANLGQVRFDRTWRLRPEGWDVIARFSDGDPALIERREKEGRIVLFASDLDRRWNDFPSQAAFVPFAVETVRYLSGTRDRGRDYLVSRVPPGVEPQPGIFRAKPDDRAVAVNVDPRESSTEAVPANEFESMVDRLPAGARADAEIRAQETESRQSYWQYGLLLMLAALAAESLVGRAQA